MKKLWFGALFCALSLIAFSCTSNKTETAKVAVVEEVTGTIPEEKELFVAVWELVDNYFIGTENLKWAECELTKIDTQDNKYELMYVGVSQVPKVDFQRQSYKVSISLNPDRTLSVTISDLKTVACDANGYAQTIKNLPTVGLITGGIALAAAAKIDNFNEKANGDEAHNHYVTVLSNAVKKALYDSTFAWTKDEAEYDKKLNATVTNPIFLQSIKDNVSMLYYKTFLDEYKVIGRTAALKVTLNNLDKSSRRDYKYRASTMLFRKNHNSDKLRQMFIFIYSNNDSWIKMKNGETYVLKGKIESVSIEETSQMLNMTIVEN